MQDLVLSELAADQKLLRRIRGDLILELREAVVALEPGHKELACGDIAKDDADVAFVGVHGADIVVLTLVEHRGFHHGAGGDDTDDVALDEPLGCLGILGLFTDRDLVAL